MSRVYLSVIEQSTIIRSYAGKHTLFAYARRFVSQFGQTCDSVFATGRGAPRALVYSALCLLVACVSNRLLADDEPLMEIHEWSVWIGEPQARGINSSMDYISVMPGLVETERSRRRESGKPGPSPLNVMTLYGKPPEVVDIDLKIPSGRPVAQWPKSDGKSNRLRWLDLKVSVEPGSEEGIATVPEGHWFHDARKLGGLYLNLKRNGRVERFLTYDLEINTALPIRLDGGPDQFKVANLGKHKLHDILLIVPDEQGRRVGWLDVANAAEGAENAQPDGANQAQVNLPAGAVAFANPAMARAAMANRVVANPQQPGQQNPGAQGAAKETVTDIPLSERLKLDSDEYRQKTRDELQRRLLAAGLNDGEVNLMFSLYEKHFFESDNIQLLFRLSKEDLEEITPLSVEPDNTRIKRVALVIAQRVDPRLREDVKQLITDLGHASYDSREKAEKRLKDLGRLAIPSLKEALKNTDQEVVMRAERLLLGLKEQLGPDQ